MRPSVGFEPASERFHEHGVVFLRFEPCHADKKHILLVESFAPSPNLAANGRALIIANWDSVWNHQAVLHGKSAFGPLSHFAGDCDGHRASPESDARQAKHKPPVGCLTGQMNCGDVPQRGAAY